MTDINLLHDRGVGEEEREAAEKAKQKARIVVELTNPNKEVEPENTEKPGQGFWSFIKELFSGKKSDQIEKPGKVKILHEERVKPPVEKPPAKPKKKIEERFVATQGQEKKLEDVFAPPAKPENERGSPTAQIRSQDVVNTPRPNLQNGEFSGVVSSMPPITPPVPQRSAPQPEKITPPDQKGEQPEITETPNGDLSTFLGVNLVPEEMMSSTSKQNRFVVLILIAVMAAAVIALLYVGLSIFQSQITTETSTKQQDIAAIDQQLQQLSSKKKAAIEFHTTTLSALNLLATHLYWTKFFAGLEKYTLQTVAINSVAVDETGHMTLSLSGKDYQSVAQQLMAFNGATDFVQSVVINSATQNTDQSTEVNFTATVILNPNVLFRDATGGPTYTMTP